ncbi:hypothetical protein DFAR_1860006 [Desulfarculales bacterium]
MAAVQKAVFDAVQGTPGLKVLIFRRAWALVQGKRGGHPYRMSVDQGLCRGDECGCHRFCSRVFCCPGLSFDEKAGRVVIDEVVCMDCGVCTQICPAGAIQAQAKEAVA